MNNNNIIPSRHNPSLHDCQEAERKLCRLFESFGVDALATRTRLIDPFLDRAIAFWRPHAGFDLGKLAIDEAEADLNAWFTGLFKEPSDEPGAAVMTGRAAFLMCGGPSLWADQFLQPLDSLPAEFVTAMRAHALNAVPPSETGEMHHQPYEAWSPTAMITRALPVDRSLFQGLAGLVRRDGFGWRGTTGPTS